MNIIAEKEIQNFAEFLVKKKAMSIEEITEMYENFKIETKEETCRHVFERGAKNKGLFCGKKTLPNENYCSKHSTVKKPVVETEATVSTEGCNHKFVKGEKKGTICGKKIKENGLCTSHLKTKKTSPGPTGQSSEPSSSSQLLQAGITLIELGKEYNKIGEHHDGKHEEHEEDEESEDDHENHDHHDHHEKHENHEEDEED